MAQGPNIEVRRPILPHFDRILGHFGPIIVPQVGVYRPLGSKMTQNRPKIDVLAIGDGFWVDLGKSIFDHFSTIFDPLVPPPPPFWVYPVEFGLKMGEIGVLGWFNVTESDLRDSGFKIWGIDALRSS